MLLPRRSMSWLLDWQAGRINQKAFHQVFTISPSHNQQWKYNLDINYAFYPSPLGRNYNQRIPRWAQGSLHHHKISPFPQNFSPKNNSLPFPADLGQGKKCNFPWNWLILANVLGSCLPSLSVSGSGSLCQFITQQEPGLSLPHTRPWRCDLACPTLALAYTSHQRLLAISSDWIGLSPHI